MAATACCALLVCSFAIFAYDQVARSSAHQAQEIAGSLGAGQPAVPSRSPGQPKRFIDGAAAVLRSPFKGLVVSDNSWVNHALPTLAGLLVYGFGLGFAARFARAGTLANKGPRMRPPHITHLR